MSHTVHITHCSTPTLLQSLQITQREENIPLQYICLQLSLVLLLLLLLIIIIIIIIIRLHYPRRISASPVALPHLSLSCATCLQLTIPIFLMPFSTSSSRLVLGLLLGRFWWKLARYIFLLFLASSTRCRYPFHPQRCSSIKVPMLTSSYKFSSSIVILTGNLLCSIIDPKMFLNVFHPKVIHLLLSVCNVSVTLIMPK